MKIEIAKDICTRCGLCKLQCNSNAIIIKHDGSFEIDKVLCDGCEGLTGKLCANVCNAKCISEASISTIIDMNMNSAIRLRFKTLLDIIAIMGSGNSSFYNQESDVKNKRAIIAKAIMNPRINLLIIEQEKEDSAIAVSSFDNTINFWEAVSIIRQRVSPAYLCRIGKSKVFIENFMNSIAPYEIMENGQPT